MADEWPDPGVDWDYPEETPKNTELWQAKIDESLNGQKLGIVKIGYKSFDLVGDCPRCGHETSHNFEVEWVVGVDDAPVEKTARTNVDCQCTGKHNQAPEKRPGCGWGGPLQSKLRVTVGGPDVVG